MFKAADFRCSSAIKLISSFLMLRRPLRADNSLFSQMEIEELTTNFQTNTCARFVYLYSSLPFLVVTNTTPPALYSL